jgi:hypothetical protein
MNRRGGPPRNLRLERRNSPCVGCFGYRLMRVRDRSEEMGEGVAVPVRSAARTRPAPTLAPGSRPTSARTSNPVTRTSCLLVAAGCWKRRSGGSRERRTRFGISGGARRRWFHWSPQSGSTQGEEDTYGAGSAETAASGAPVLTTSVMVVTDADGYGPTRRTPQPQSGWTSPLHRSAT